MVGRKVLFLILDGFGINNKNKGNAINAAKTPNIDKLYKTSIHTTLNASGIYVGLPKGVMGNSEVGHMTIGSGRRVKQYYSLINDDIKTKKFFENKELKKEVYSVIEKKKNIHIMGLLSDGGIHSHIDHLIAIIKYIQSIQKDYNIYIHVFSDGRDSEYISVEKYISYLKKRIKGNVYFASIIGRYFAMDRDKRWDRTKEAFDLLTMHNGEEFSSIEDSIKTAYSENISDEFINPSFISNTPVISKNDLIIFFNFREDRARQISKMFKDNKFNILCMVQYDTIIDKFIYKRLRIDETLSEIISLNNLRQLKIAETEKYAHVTYFFNGGKENPYKLEKRILIPSLKVATYDKVPFMRAREITNKIIENIDKNYSLITVNFANADMVGHTGNFLATKNSISILDKMIGKIVKSIQGKNINLIITGDHGNAEEMIRNGTIYKEHTTNMVPFIFKNDFIKKEIKIDIGELEDIAPTILSILKLHIPKEMQGIDLLKI